MKFWLIVFVFTQSGMYTETKTYQTNSRKECVELSEKIDRKDRLINVFCVTDAHYKGTDLDQDMPLDIDGYYPQYARVQR